MEEYMEHQMEVEFRTSVKDLKSMIFFNMFLKKKFTAFFLMIASILSPLIVVGRYVGFLVISDWYFFACLGFCVLVILQFVVYQYTVKKFLSTDKLTVGNLRTWTISEDGIEIEGGIENSSASYKWDVFHRVYDTKKYYYLYVNTLQAIILPKRMFTAEQGYELRTLMRAQLGNRYCKW